MFVEKKMFLFFHTLQLLGEYLVGNTIHQILQKMQDLYFILITLTKELKIMRKDFIMKKQLKLLKSF